MSSFKNKSFVCVDAEVLKWNNDQANVGETYTWYLDMAWPSTIDDLLRFCMIVEGKKGEEFEDYLQEEGLKASEYLDFAFPLDSSDTHPWAGMELGIRGRSKQDSEFIVIRWSKPKGSDDEDEDEDEDED
jgi:hypothetical protein